MRRLEGRNRRLARRTCVGVSLGVVEGRRGGKSAYDGATGSRRGA